jgi:hypothetical protein
VKQHAISSLRKKSWRAYTALVVGAYSESVPSVSGAFSHRGIDMENSYLKFSLSSGGERFEGRADAPSMGALPLITQRSADFRSVAAVHIDRSMRHQGAPPRPIRPDGAALQINFVCSQRHSLCLDNSALTPWLGGVRGIKLAEISSTLAQHGTSS